MKFKVGQKVFYYLMTGDFQGRIVECTICKAVKDLATKKVIYTVSSADPYWNCFVDSKRELEEDYLYASRKKIEKEYKEEIIHNDLVSRINDLEKVLNQVYNELTKDEHKDWGGMTLNIDGEKKFSTIYVKAEDVNIEGIGSVKDEIAGLKKEINKIKKAIKPKTKKPVVDKKSEENK